MLRLSCLQIVRDCSASAASLDSKEQFHEQLGKANSSLLPKGSLPSVHVTTARLELVTTNVMVHNRTS